MMKKYYKNILAVCLSTFVVFFVITGPVYDHYKVSPSPTTEMLCVPMQQIALCIVEDEQNFTPWQAEKAKMFFDTQKVKEVYNPRFGDPVKFFTAYGATINDNKGEFIKLWLSLLPTHIKQYTNAFLSLNLGYWFPDAPQPDRFSQRAYIETEMGGCVEFRAQRNSKAPKLYEYYEDFANCSAQQEIPLFSLLFSIGMPIWFLMICITICIARKKKELILLYLPAVFLWLTLMAGPVSNLRYVFPIMMAYPLMFAVALQANLFDKEQ